MLNLNQTVTQLQSVLKQSLILSVLVGSAFVGQSQAIEKPEFLTHTFNSKAFKTERKIDISLPTGYNPEDATQTYMVAYLFDGQFQPYFDMVTSVSDYYQQVSEGVPMIVVSIYTENRSLEFTPKWNFNDTFNGWRENCGSADLMTQHLREEVIPYIESTYHVKKYRLGIGHSLGGTYVISEIFKENSIFNAVIAASPNLNYDHEQILDSGLVYFEKYPNSKAFIFSSAGDQGNMEQNFEKSLRKLDSMAQEKKSDNLIWECKWLPNDGHMGSFLPTFNYGYLAFSKLWVLSDEDVLEMATKDASMLGLINAFYANLSGFATETMEPTLDQLNNYAYIASYEEEYGKAIEILDYAIAKWPKDPNLLDSKAEMLSEQGKYEESKKMYQKALALLESDTAYYDSENYAYYKESMTKSIKRLSPNFIKYKGLIADGTQLTDEKKFEKASELFTEAFKLDFKNGTHVDRMHAVEAYAQSGEFDNAFEQLNLLANYFKWRGSDFFKKNELMRPLHKDKRWDKLMVIFEENE